MKYSEIGKVLDAELLTNCDGGDSEFAVACGADLMSDILAHASSGAVLVTGLTTAQAVRTAEMADLTAIIFVRNKRPPNEVIQLGEARDIPIWVSKYNMFEACGKLYAQGVRTARIE